MKYAVVTTVKDRFVMEVEAISKAEAREKVRRCIEGLGLTIVDLDGPLLIRTIV